MGGPLKRVFASTLYSEFIDNEERNQFVFDFAGGARAAGRTITPGATGYQPVVLASRQLEYGKYENSTATTTLGADFDLANWDIESRLNFTETTNDLLLPIPYGAGGTIAASYDLSNTLEPDVRIFRRGTQTPMALQEIAFAANLGILVNSSLDNEAVKFKVDAKTDTTWFTGDTTFAAGAQYDTRDANGVAVAQTAGNFPSSVNVAAYRTNVPWHTDFNNSIGATYYNNKGLRAAWENAIGGFQLGAPADQLIVIKEDIISAYAMATTRFDGGNLVYGARVESTDYTSDGPAIDVSYSNDYVTFLPSVHANFDLRDDLKLRVSGTTGLSRPTYNELRASATVNPTNRTVIGGNPTLEAETTWGVDTSLEWYFAPASLISAAAFHRNIEDVIYADATTIDGGLYVPAAAGEEWTLTGFVNGGAGHLSGLEFNLLASGEGFLPGPFDGLGVNANVTLLDSEFETNGGTKFSLPGTSETIFNASLFYEKFGFSARVNYQYRDAWLSTTENDSFGEYWDAQQRVDLSVRYTLPYSVGSTHATLFANANNITDEKDVRYSGTPRTPNQYEGYGRYWVAGVRFDF
jgi:TonB-dependent receptor